MSAVLAGGCLPAIQCRSADRLGYRLTKTATVRAGTVNVPVTASTTAVLTTGSAPCAWTGWSRSLAPRLTAAVAVGVALKTTTRP